MRCSFYVVIHLFRKGQCANPKVAWQIDPFGHSKEQARLFARMGLEGLFFARADFRDKEQRKAEKTLNMMWKGGPYDGPVGRYN